MKPLSEILDTFTQAGALFVPENGNAVRCIACAHRCLIRPNRRGICQVRFNRDGELRVPWGYVAALQADPIEKKPFCHFLPGSTAFTFGMLGCDFHCAYCQNWLTSQALRDPASELAARLMREITPEELIAIARKNKAQTIVSSYNEPLITSEWAAAIFALAKAQGMKCAFVSNGNATLEVLQYLSPYLDACKIDLKSMQDRNYRKLGGTLTAVLDSIQNAHALGLWVEIVTLIVPGFNDSDDELWDAARFIASLSLDIPWHVTAFHKDYRMTAPANTPSDTLLRAAEIGQEAGLRYVYAGNLPGRVQSYENTLCPTCSQTLIRRTGYTIMEYYITASGGCTRCQTPIAGIWAENPKEVRLHGYGLPLPIA